MILTYLNQQSYMMRRLGQYDNPTGLLGLGVGR